jgi:pantoate--beta-alanine ligase
VYQILRIVIGGYFGNSIFMPYKTIGRSFYPIKSIDRKTMRVFKTLTEFSNFRNSLKSTSKVGFVPTMGSLHAGHIKLIEKAREQCNVVVTSIFVNKLQFGPNEDYTAYPRDLESDKHKIITSMKRNDVVDVVFAPETEEMYPIKSTTTVTVQGMDDTYEGKARPGHFTGVATVLSKLFHCVQPNVVFFGQKDAIQCILVKRLVNDLNFPLNIEIVPTIRESDGLAMSSRNVYLNERQRKIAPVLNRSLRACEETFKASHGNITSNEMKRIAMRILSTEPEATVDYISLVDIDTGIEVDHVVNSAFISGVIKLGKTRLLDNVILYK